MPPQAVPLPAIEPAILGEAADWLVQLQSGAAHPDDYVALQRWCARSPAHASAWRSAEAVLATFGQVPAQLGRETLRRVARPGRRRQLLNTLGVGLLAGPAAWYAWRSLPWQDWSADYRTATGEQKSMRLADGTQLVLNTASAVDIRFTAGERRVVLQAGEILITTGRDPAPVARPFIVQTAQGTAQALGTRFSMRRRAASTDVSVFQGAVRIRPIQTTRTQIVEAGQRTCYGAARIGRIQAADGSATLWTHGMVLAKSMRLADLVAELARYRHGVLRCDPRVADLRVSGAFPVSDIDASLRLLRDTFPLRVSSVTRYWVTLEPA